jgi:transcriptional regulator with XRE-family HTH domain
MNLPKLPLAEQAVATLTPMRQRRLELRMRLTELAGLTGLDLGLVSRIDTGQRRPTIPAALKIARGLGRPVNVLFPDLLNSEI